MPDEENDQASGGDVGSNRRDVVQASQMHLDSRQPVAAFRLSPRKCCGKNARLTPTKVSQKCSLPMISEYMYPVIFGNQ